MESFILLILLMHSGLYGKELWFANIIRRKNKQKSAKYINHVK